MTAAGYRRRQRRKGYPRQVIRDLSFGTLRAGDIRLGEVRQYRVLSPEETTARYPVLRDFRGRAG